MEGGLYTEDLGTLGPEEGLVKLGGLVGGDERLEESLAREILIKRDVWIWGVDLSSNELSFEAVGRSQGLAKLRRGLISIDLSNNRLDLIPRVVVSSLLNLKVLMLANNRIRDVIPFLSQLKSLEALDLSGNLLTSLPVELSKLENLRTLSVCRNKLRSLPPQFTDLRKLENLYLSGNDMGPSIPLVVYHMTSLKSLGLNRNYIDHVKPIVSQLENLQVLSLVYNSVEYLPLALFNCKNLQRLNLSNNKLNSIPPDIEKLTELEELYLDSNDLAVLPEEVGSLPKLKVLSVLENPQLIGIPAGLENLEELGFSGSMDKWKDASNSGQLKRVWNRIAKHKEDPDYVEIGTKTRGHMPSWFHGGR
ncbi:hypothetical protein NDN08_006213 [Rhodosorus marinus]|uniref:Disease resistance R13L4/SHOC-2-like LRR domain-containing protein n=1 Tax=Rhodosorus marinus TaxID=101924 RepID=A0AAV8UMW2_9RHOD|nr:hypothetical protein NDN08_006213 [Rhodosorus marinus]